jgi:hypothetical protein
MQVQSDGVRGLAPVPLADAGAGGRPREPLAEPRLGRNLSRLSERGLGVALRDAKLQGANLRYANLRGALLQGAKLQDAKLEGADLRRWQRLLCLPGNYQGAWRGVTHALAVGFEIEPRDMH